MRSSGHDLAPGLPPREHPGVASREITPSLESTHHSVDGAGGRDEARTTVRPSGNRAATGQRDKARLSTTRGPGPTAPKHREGPADGARRCGQPRVLRGRGAQDWYHRDAHFADWALSSPPTCGQKTRRSDSSARVRARRRVRAVSRPGKPGAQMQRRSPQHKSTRAAPPAAPSGVGVPRPGCPALTQLALDALAT